ncbi:MAG: MoaD/ThiS family protein [Bacillota bacterium]
MQVHVRLNGILIDRFGQARISVTLPKGGTVADLLKLMAAGHPDADGALRASIAVVGGHHVGRNHRLDDQDEIALLMPVSGG